MSKEEEYSQEVYKCWRKWIHNEGEVFNGQRLSNPLELWKFAEHYHQEQLKGVTYDANNPSRDYNHLYKLISEGKMIIPCFVDHTFRDDSKIYRDVACVKMRPDTTISIGVRGIQYGGVDSWHLKDNNGLELFIIECERLNLEFYKN